MTEKKSVTFRCDADLLEAIDNLGRERYPAKTPHGYDHSKNLMEVLQLNIEALSDGSVVLPAPAFVRQQPDSVRRSLSDSLLDAGITDIVERKTELLRAKLKAELKAELLEKSAA